MNTEDINEDMNNEDKYKKHDMIKIVKYIKYDKIYKNLGWYQKSIYLLKYLNNDKVLEISRCLNCYQLISFNNIKYSKILISSSYKNYNNNVICYCSECYEYIITNNLIPKIAPSKIYNIIEDYIENNKYNLLIDIIKHNFNHVINNIESDIEYMNLNINEKKEIYNNLVNDNNQLTKNILVEIEKNKILNDHFHENKNICNKIKNQLLQSVIDLFKDHKLEIDKHINKYEELNNNKLYTFPECKVCCKNEIKLTLLCGHLLCQSCYNSLLQQSDNLNIICPICRSISTQFITLFY